MRFGNETKICRRHQETRDETRKMVNCVELSSDVYLVCLAHALSTEKEEVMGLLLGEVRGQGGGGKIR